MHFFPNVGQASKKFYTVSFLNKKYLGKKSTLISLGDFRGGWLELRQLGLKCFYFLVPITLSQALSPITKLVHGTAGATGNGKSNWSGKPRRLRRVGIRVASEVPREGQRTS